MVINELTTIYLVIIINKNFRFIFNIVIHYIISKSVPITTDVVSVNPAHGKMYSIQHYVIKFVSDL